MYIYIIFSEEVQIFCTLAQRKGISCICPFFIVYYASQRGLWERITAVERC